jgi:hypothetical protein
VDNASSVLLPQGKTVVVGGTAYPIVSFSFAKTIKATDLVTEIAESAGLGHLMNGGLGEARDNVLVGKADSIVGQIMHVVPKLLREGIIPLYRLIGLITLTNSEFEGLVLGGSNVNEEMYSRVLLIGHRGSLDDVKAIIAAGLDSLANEPIIKELPNVVGVWLRSLLQTSTPA